MADRAVKNFVDFRFRSKQEWHFKHSQFRQEVTDRSVGNYSGVNGSHLHAFDQSAFIAERCIGEDFHFDFALRLGFDDFLELETGDVVRVFLINNMG